MGESAKAGAPWGWWVVIEVLGLFESSGSCQSLPCICPGPFESLPENWIDELLQTQSQPIQQIQVQRAGSG